MQCRKKSGNSYSIFSWPFISLKKRNRMNSYFEVLDVDLERFWIFKSIFRTGKNIWHCSSERTTRIWNFMELALLVFSHSVAEVLNDNLQAKVSEFWNWYPKLALKIGGWSGKWWKSSRDQSVAHIAMRATFTVFHVVIFGEEFELQVQP